MSRPTKNKLLISVMALALVAGGAAVIQMANTTDAAAQGAPGEMPAMPVAAITIEQKPVQIWKEFSGRLVAVDYVEIRPQVSGIINEVNFEDGQIVNKGDVLFKIDPRPYEAAVALAQAAVTGAKDMQALSQKELARAEELLKSGAISKQGYDERVNSLKVDKSTLNGAYAQLKSAQVNLDHATIKAPVSGRISRPEITEGNLVNAASAPLLTTIVSDKEIYADFEVDEQTYLNFVRGGASQSLEAEKAIPVRLLLKSDTQKTNPYEGTIKSFDNKINPSSGTIRVRAVFNNADGALLPGMFVMVQIGSSSTEPLITVPEQAVLTDQSKKFVYVGNDGSATYREVKLGDTVSGNRVVLSGLEPGDKVIIDGLMKLRPGAKVQPMSPEEMKAMKAQQQGGTIPATDAPKKEEPKAEETPDEAIPFDEPAADAPAAVQAPEETPAQE